jgi:hypothetical protein
MKNLLKISQTPEFKENGEIVLHIKAKIRKRVLVWLYVKMFTQAIYINIIKSR